jgi:hypothetical protein
MDRYTGLLDRHGYPCGDGERQTIRRIQNERKKRTAIIAFFLTRKLVGIDQHRHSVVSAGFDICGGSITAKQDASNRARTSKSAVSVTSQTIDATAIDTKGQAQYKSAITHRKMGGTR